MRAIITAGLKGLVADLAAKTATAKGNVLKGLKSLREKGVVKGVLRSMAVVGLTAGILGNSAVAELDGLPKKLAESSVRATLNIAADIAIDGVKPSEAAKNAAKQTITETVSRTISSNLGKLYHAGKLPDLAHEALHGASAYTIEKFRSGSTKKAKAAAAGAISAEVFGKLYISNADVFNNPSASPEDLDKAITTGVELAEITAASVATALSLDANVAVSAATIAASENSFKKQKEKLTRLLQNIQGEFDEEFLVQEEQNRVETDAQVAVAKELLAEIKANPAAFFKGCAEVGGEIVVPGGVKHFSALLANKQTLSEFLTNQKRSIGEEVAMGMVVGGKIAKGSKKFKAVVKYVDGKYQAKLANIKLGKANAVNLTNNKTFTQRINWTAPAGTKQNYRIYQRNDIDWNMIRTKGAPKYIGKTNREACLAGRAPQLPDGKLVTLHHIGQNSKGPLVEASTKFHNTKNKQAFKALHNQYGGKSHPKYPVNHDVRWNSDRENYWKWRAKNAE